MSCVASLVSPDEKKPADAGLVFGAPGRSRTADRLVRSQVLYPAELRARTEGADYIREMTKKRRGGAAQVKLAEREAALAHPVLHGICPSWTSGFSPSSRVRIHLPAIPKPRTLKPQGPRFRNWRRERDSNPRYAFGVYALSRGAPSTTRPSLRSGGGQEYPQTGGR